MGGKWLALAFAWAALAVSSSAGALQTAWEIKGHLTSLDPGSSFPADFAVGAPFRVLTSFDTTGETYSTTPTTGGGYKYLYTADTLAYQVFIGTTCAPCNPVGDPTQSGIIVRDNAPDPATGQMVDGYSFFLVTGDGTRVNLFMRGPVLDIVTGAGLAAVPDPRLAGLATSLMQICDSGGYCVSGAIESVASPAVGTTYFLSARDCYTIDTTSASADTAPRDCIYVDSLGQTRLGRGRFIDAGGGLGSSEFGRTVVFDGSLDPAILAPLGSVYGAITFNGPAGLPVLRASSAPTDVSRTNSNLLGYQRYAYAGPATPMPLVVDLSYGIADHSADTTASSEVGLRPGGAQIAATVAIVDGGIPMPSLAGNINTLTCGTESTLLLPDGVTPWPEGSILGSAAFNSPGGQVDPGAATTLDVRSCANPSMPVQLAANQSFIVATSVQTPARGKWSTGTPAVANGYIDASHTMRVTFDPNAPPALVQQLADNITPACSNCSPPEVTAIAVDVRPGSTGCINPTSNGVIPVAILGSATFSVKDVRLDDSLTLGSLALRVRGSKPLCSVTRVNTDGYDDLVCHFDNVSTSWASGQTMATVSGKLYNGLPIRGSGTICVK